MTARLVLWLWSFTFDGVCCDIIWIPHHACVHIFSLWIGLLRLFLWIILSSETLLAAEDFLERVGLHFLCKPFWNVLLVFVGDFDGIVPAL